MRARIATIKATDKLLFIEDVGDWNRDTTVTNDAEQVVAWLYKNNLITGKRLFYRDSEGDAGELKHEQGIFVGFGNDLEFLKQELY